MSGHRNGLSNLSGPVAGTESTGCVDQTSLGLTAGYVGGRTSPANGLTQNLQNRGPIVTIGRTAGVGLQAGVTLR